MELVVDNSSSSSNSFVVVKKKRGRTKGSKQQQQQQKEEKRKKRRRNTVEYALTCPQNEHGQYIIENKRNTRIIFDRTLNRWIAMSVNKLSTQTLGTYNNLKDAKYSVSSYKRLRKLDRECQQNKSKYQDASTFRGVKWDESKQVWKSFICCKLDRIELGEYQTAEEAALAYNAYAIKIRGPKSKTLNRVSNDMMTFRPDEPQLVRMSSLTESVFSDDDIKFMNQIDTYGFESVL